MIDKRLKYYAKKLNQDAPEGEFLAYINKKESNLLKRKGGLGIKTRSGIPSYIGSDASGQGGGGTGAGPGDASDSDSGGGKGKGDPDNNREQYGAVGQYSDPPSSPKSSDGPTNIHVDDPNAPPAYEIIGGQKFDVTPATKDIRERAKVKQAILNPTVKRNKIFDPISKNFINPFATTQKRGPSLLDLALFAAGPLGLFGKTGKTVATAVNLGKKAKKGLEAVTSIADTFGINTDSITNSLSNSFSGKNSNTKSNTNTNTNNGGEGLASLENQASGYDEYVLLLQKLQSGNISDSERNRFNVLKNMLGI